MSTCVGETDNIDYGYLVYYRAGILSYPSSEEKEYMDDYMVHGSVFPLLNEVSVQFTIAIRIGYF